MWAARDNFPSRVMEAMFVMFKRFRAVTAAAVLAAFSLGNVANGATGASGPTAAKIGVIIAAVGPVADWGTALRRASELAIADYNAGGGYEGRPVEAVYCENEGKPERAIECATKLIQENKVVALVGGAPSGSALAMLNVPQDQKVPYMNTSSATSITTRYKDIPGNYIFRGVAPDSAQFDALLNWAKSRHFTRLGLLSDTTGYGSDAKKDFDREAKARGFIVTDEESFAITDTDMTPQVEKMRASKPDAVLVYTIGGPAARVLESARKIGYAPNWAGPWIFAAADFRRLAGADSNGLHVSVPFTEGATKSLAAFHERMIRTYREDPMGVYTPLAYDAITLVLQALRRSGPNPQKLRDAIESTSGFHGITNIPSHPFTSSDHDSLHPDNIIVGVMHDGRVVKQ
ncbi:MAG: ABC transporter substrate-binding protein [Candidatus Eremiobacteraeota bacterium]|nr:ABC transporter substrate-binding protein [Candidatus Eremiobacteraeota bacterium]